MEKMACCSKPTPVEEPRTLDLGDKANFAGRGAWADGAKWDIPLLIFDVCICGEQMGNCWNSCSCDGKIGSDGVNIHHALVPARELVRYRASRWF